ncbi:MAG TPA: hypothetical protein VM936_20405 [Pyrinomonadaceae bacterium]|jgi:hypothetical protein|nr:hypothetical protein [Pyrinomonadaceae bacterium]
MTPTHRKVFRVASLLVALCVANVYVFAGPVAAYAPQTGGTLTTTDNKQVLVNGNRVGSGTTILPNTSIQTPSGVGASVQLGFAEVTISPGSDIVLDFQPGTEVTVTLKRGCVVIRTQGNATGMIIRPDGTSVATGTGRVANACDREGAAIPVKGGVGTIGGGIDKGLLALLFIAAGGATVAALTLAGRGFNPSPSNP